MTLIRSLLAATLICLSPGLLPAEAASGPEAPARSYGQNYKDMILASCLARAYKQDAVAGKDAGFSASVFIDWTLFDVEKSQQEIDQIIERYLARDYRHPLKEYEGVDFQLLKCLDLYHSKDLDRQMRKFVPNLRRTFRQDYRKP